MRIFYIYIVWLMAFTMFYLYFFFRDMNLKTPQIIGKIVEGDEINKNNYDIIADYIKDVYVNNVSRNFSFEILKKDLIGINIESADKYSNLKIVFCNGKYIEDVLFY